MQEEAQPRALAAALRAHAVHPVVPVAASEQRQPVRAGRQALVDRPHAVLEERSLLPGHARLEVGLLHVRAQRRCLQERHELVEDSRVAGRPRVVSRRVRQPQQVVRATGAGAASARLVPPVLNVAFDELMGGRPQQVLAREVRADECERHRVLELVAEAERPAGLVVAGARPEATAQVLVEQPAVHQQVEGVVRGAHLHRVERPVPRLSHVRRALARPQAPSRDAKRARELRGRPWPGPARTRGRAFRRGRARARRAAPRRDRGPRRSGRRAPRGRGLPDARATRCGPGTRPGRRLPSAGLRSRGRRPRGPGTRCCRDCARGSRRWPDRARSPRAAPGPRAADPGSTRCRRRRSGGGGAHPRSSASAARASRDRSHPRTRRARGGCRARAA